jgi:hypothetical protein
MQKKLIHIGYPKTATTWFARYFYPFVTNAETYFHDDLYFDFSEGNEKFELRNTHPVSGADHLILFTHAFSGLYNFRWENSKYRNFFLKHLKQKFPDAEIIIFIRNQIDFIASGYSTYLTHGGTYTFNKLFKPGLIDGELFPLEYLNYCETIRAFRENFGCENVYVYIYEEFLENNETFIKKLIATHGLDFSVKELHRDKTNEKLRIGLANLLRLSNKFVKNGAMPRNYFFSFPFFRSFLIKRIDKLNTYVMFGRRVPREELLSKEQEDFLNNYFRLYNQELIQKFNLERIKKYNYPL